MKHSLILSFILAIGFSSFAQSGSLDATFGSHGKVTTDFQNHHISYGYAIARQADGKIILAGNYTNINNVFVPAMARYNKDGTLDAGFGVSGQVFTDFAGTINAIAIQSDGKIVIAGSFNGDFMTVRFNSSGFLDNTFGSGGIVITDIEGNDDESASSVAVQSDGKIMVIGNTGSFSTFDCIAVRYNSDGTLDSKFNKNGKVITKFNDDTQLESVAIQGDGKIVAAGSTFTNSPSTDWDFLVIRYNTNGSLDNSFSGDGKAITDLGGLDRRIMQVQ